MNMGTDDWHNNRYNIYQQGYRLDTAPVSTSRIITVMITMITITTSDDYHLPPRVVSVAM